jgi:transcriptional regulator with XRE-family HTH domain
MSLGTMLGDARKAKKASLAATGRAAGISASYVQKLERDQVRCPSPRVLHALAQQLDLSYSALMVMAGYVVPAGARRTPENAGPLLDALGISGPPRSIKLDADLAAKIEAMSVAVVQAQLDAMTDARDLCKRQTQEVSDKLMDLLGWLRDEHPEVYAAWGRRPTKPQNEQSAGSTREDRP